MASSKEGATTDIDRRHGDPDAGGLSSGEKAAATRAVKYGDELQFLEDASPEKRAAAEEHMSNVRPDPSERADHPLSNQANKKRQEGSA
ncbi:hypothetical protein C2E21_3905 [Chlorella sorokiniana]|uniref:Uncharacterized protein n=1 Tax=Chlorella sorokiniana TaxID=3076 RepID=A0A2P6TSX4_CHLSO|nr:hypothetical protein C2E21_3905 [Chlorella sorokiniana]|eukprot:PRW57162.1 hypothetical protein C2E21_3905 [Chlorella sorokiniana]